MWIYNHQKPISGYAIVSVNPNQRGYSQNFLSQIHKFFVTLGLYILKILILKVLFSSKDH